MRTAPQRTPPGEGDPTEGSDSGDQEVVSGAMNFVESGAPENDRYKGRVSVRGVTSKVSRANGYTIYQGVTF